MGPERLSSTENAA